MTPQPREQACLCWCRRTTWNLNALCDLHQVSDPCSLGSDRSSVDSATSSSGGDASVLRPAGASPENDERGQA